MRKHKLAVTLEDSFVNHHKDQELSTDSHFRFQSATRLLQALMRNGFKLEDIVIQTPESILGRESAVVLDGNKFAQYNEPISADIGLIFAVNSNSDKFGLKNLAEQYTAYEELNIGRYMNPLVSKKLIDKARLYDFSIPGFILPKRIESGNWNQIFDAVQEQGKIILKHRAGADGEHVYLVDADNYGTVREKVGDQLDEYLAQEMLLSVYEQRLMFFGDQIIPGYSHFQKKRPWETKKTTMADEADIFVPTQHDIELVGRVRKVFQLDYGSVDFLETAERKVVLEINGICPGLYRPDLQGGVLYNHTDNFAKFVHNQWQTGKDS